MQKPTTIAKKRTSSCGDLLLTVRHAEYYGLFLKKGEFLGCRSGWRMVPFRGKVPCHLPLLVLRAMREAIKNELSGGVELTLPLGR